MSMAAALQPAQAKAPPPVAAPLAAASILEGALHDSGPTASLSRIPLTAVPPPAPPPPTPPAPRATTANSMVQRKCEACEQEEQSDSAAVQMRLEVGAADDPFEHEADVIAGHVMALRDGDIGAAPQSRHAAGPMVQRACASCATSSDDEAKARRSAEQGSDDEDMLRMAPDQPAAAARDSGADLSDQRLTNGGSPMAASTRRFFESRMGRDLGSVKIHRGGASNALNAAIGARAFTYRNHIWLGPKETDAPSFTMAHELAHVLQQTDPGPVGPSQTRHAERDSGTVRRIECSVAAQQFFFPASDRSGTTDAGHDAAVKAATGLDPNLLGEVRVPNANRNGAQTSLRNFGYADLVKSNNGKPVGIGFSVPSQLLLFPQDPPVPWASVRSPLSSQRLVPTNLTSERASYRNGTEYGVSQTNAAYSRNAAPRADSDPNDGYTRVAAHAPTSLEIGDVKFAGTNFRSREVQEQVDNYATGFETARSHYNETVENYDAADPANQGGGSFTPRSGTAPQRWELNAGRMSASSYSSSWHQLGDRQALRIGRWHNPGGWQRDYIRPCDRTQTYHGHLFYRKNPAVDVRWDYIWWPDSTPGEYGPTRERLLSTYLDRARQLEGQLVASPTGERGIRRLSVKKGISAKVDQDQKGVVRPQRRPRPIPRRDPFVTGYPTWRTQQRSLTRDWDRFGESSGGEEAIGSLLFDSAVKNTTDAIGRAPNGRELDRASDSRLRTGERELNLVDRMSGPSGRYLGILRKTFGSAFIRVVNIYQNLRERFDRFMRDRRRGGLSRGSGLAKAAMKVGAMIFAAITRELLPRVGEILMQCLETGFRRKMEEAFSADYEAVVGDRIEEIQSRYNEIETQIETQIQSVTDGMFGDMTGRFQTILDQWHAVGELITIAKTAFNAARIAVCLAGGLETVGIACAVAGVDFILSLLGVSPVELLAASLLGTCAAQQLIAEHILTIRAVRDTPRYLATSIIDLLRRHLPSEVSELLCDTLPADAELPTVDEITCGEGGSATGVEASSWRAPQGVPRSVINRRATDAEIAEHGRLDLGTSVAGAAEDAPPSGSGSDPEPSAGTGPSASDPVGEPAAADAGSAAGGSDGMTADVANVVLSNEDLESDRTTGVTLTLSGEISAGRRYQDETIVASLEANLADGVVLRAVDRNFRISSIPGQSGNSAVTGWPIETLTWRYLYTRADGTRIERANSLAHDRERPFGFNVEGAAE